MQITVSGEKKKLESKLDRIQFSRFFLSSSFNKLHLLMEELEQKHLHLLQVVESEKTAKWQYTQHCEELTEEIKKLRNEVSSRFLMTRAPEWFSTSAIFPPSRGLWWWFSG